MHRDSDAYAWGNKCLCIEDYFIVHKGCNAYA